MATKTKIVLIPSGAKITVVSDKASKLAYGFRRTGRNTVAVATAICVYEDKFSHRVARSLLVDRFYYGYTMNLRIPANVFNQEDTAKLVKNVVEMGNIDAYFS